MPKESRTSERSSLEPRASRLKREFIERIRGIDTRCGGDSVNGRYELQMLRREYHIAVIASRLESAHSKDAATLNDLRAAAASILDKAGLNTERDVGEERRSKDEERLVNAARQGWHQALKGAGVLAVDRRGGGHNRTRAAGRSLFRRLYRLKRGELLADEGAELLVNYARWRLYQLLELFEEVEQASPGYIRDDVRSMGKTLRTLIK